MSKKQNKKSLAAQERRDKRMEAQGKSIMRWLCAAMAILFIIIFVAMAYMGS